MSADDSELQQAILASLDVSKPPKRAAAKKAGRKAAGKKAGKAAGRKAAGTAPAPPTEEELTRRQIMAEQDLAYEEALRQDRLAEEQRRLAEEQRRLAEEQARVALQDAELARRDAAERAQRLRITLEAQWRPFEAEHGTADHALATHHLRIVGRFGQMRLAFLPTAPISALSALIQCQFGLTDFALPAVDDASLPIATLPNWSVVRVVEK